MSVIRKAAIEDLPTIVALLKESRLPYTDIGPAHLQDFLVATSGDVLLGVIGLERYENAALLRSLAVREESRRSGLGSTLTRHLEAYAVEGKLSHLYLLTMTAADFFTRHGYAVCPRSTVPDALHRSSQFTGLCPSQAVCMHKFLQ